MEMNSDIECPFAAIPPFLMNHLEKKAFLKVGLLYT